MIIEETIDLEAWTYFEIAEMEAVARGFIAGILSATPFEARGRIKMKLGFRNDLSIHVSNLHDEKTVLAFGYRVVDEECYGDEVFLCEIETYSIDFDKHGLGSFGLKS